MKFEEALSAMKTGKKIRYPHMAEDEYYQGCYITLKFTNETLEDAKKRGVSIVWMKGDKQHPDMLYKWNPYDPKTDPCKHGMCPVINLFWLMSDYWEIVE